MLMLLFYGPLCIISTAHNIILYTVAEYNVKTFHGHGVHVVTTKTLIYFNNRLANWTFNSGIFTLKTFHYIFAHSNTCTL